VSDSPELDRLLHEIGEQPDVVARLLDQQRAAVREVARTIRLRETSAIVLVARGSSDNAAVYRRYLLEVCNRRLTSLAAPSGLTLYGRGPRLERTVVIGVSQSGQGEEVVAYVREARRQGAVAVAIVNDEHSPLAETAECVLACPAGPELSVPATRTVTAQMTLLAMISRALDDDADSPGLELLSDGLRAAVSQRPGAARLAGLLAGTTLGSVIGRGLRVSGGARDCAEAQGASYTRAEPFSAADFLHAPVALVDAEYSALVIDVGGKPGEAALESARTVRQRAGQVAMVRAGRIHEQIDQPSPSLAAPIAEPFATIVALVLGQLLAVELALALGLDPARPRGLGKVTSTA
jgi:glutamine---fructose-6-phosphate transaminase (isomerizing)